METMIERLVNYLLFIYYLYSHIYLKTRSTLMKFCILVVISNGFSTDSVFFFFTEMILKKKILKLKKT